MQRGRTRTQSCQLGWSNIPLSGCVAFLTALFVATSAEVYTSTAQLEHVLSTEGDVVAVLDDYLRHHELKLERIRRYIRDYERIITDDYSVDVENPLNAYQLMKRLAVDWVQLENEMKQHEWTNVLADVQQRRSLQSMPEETDLQGAALALIRLKKTYHLNVTELSQGNLQGIYTQVQLTARDCLYLGRNTMSLGVTDHAIEWLEQAMILAGREGNQTATQEEIRPHLQEAIFMNDRTERSKRLKASSSYIADNPRESFDLQPNQRFFKNSVKYNIGLYSSPDDDVKNYDALCRGEKLRAPDYESQLKCYYSSGVRDHPYLRLRRVKVEENHLEPLLLTFHDVIYDSEIKFIQQLAKPMLERSTVVGTNGVWRQVSDTRTSKNMWIFNDIVQENPVLQRIQERIHWITGLNVATDDDAEAMQIANYGMGGHYVHHHDFLYQYKSSTEMASVDPKEFELGDRLATLMFYLSDVTRGGATVFPKLGAAVWPKKGSAAFWYNIKRNGEGDVMTLHGACPVLHGSKWVANKWIRERSQMFVHKCGKDQNEN